MSIEQNKTIVREIFAALDERDLDGVVARYAPDCRFYGWAPETLDTAGYKVAMAALLAAFPDSRFAIEDMVAEGNRVAVRHSLRGTHGAELLGIPATGKPVVVNAIAILRLEKGEAVELWLNADFAGLMQQLGGVPEPG